MSSVSCFICGQSVSKRKTLAVGEGYRACRNHSDVLEMSQLLQKKEKDKRDRRREQETLERKARQEKKLHKFIPRCLICGEEGLRQDSFYLQWLITSTHYEYIPLGNAPPIFDLKMMAAPLLELNQQCLYFVRWVGPNTKISLNENTTRVIMLCQQVCDPVVFLACGKCCKEKNLMPVISERNNKNIPLEKLVVATNLLDQVVKGS